MCSPPTSLRRANTERPFNANARTEMAVTGMTTGAPIAPKGVPTGDISDLGFRIAQTLRHLKIPRKTLYDKLKRHGLKPASFRRH